MQRTTLTKKQQINMTLEESETTIVYDYAGNTVSFFTTRRGQYTNLKKRIKDKNILAIRGDKANGWLIEAKMEAFRDPYMVSKVIKD